MVAVGEFAVRQCRATVQHANAHPTAGQPTRIRMVRADGLQAPIGLEFVGLPAVGVANLTLLVVLRCLLRHRHAHAAQQQCADDRLGQDGTDLATRTAAANC